MVYGLEKYVFKALLVIHQVVYSTCCL